MKQSRSKKRQRTTIKVILVILNNFVMDGLNQFYDHMKIEVTKSNQYRIKWQLRREKRKEEIVTTRTRSHTVTVYYHTYLNIRIVGVDTTNHYHISEISFPASINKLIDTKISSVDRLRVRNANLHLSVKRKYRTRGVYIQSVICLQKSKIRQNSTDNFTRFYF